MRQFMNEIKEEKLMSESHIKSMELTQEQLKKNPKYIDSQWMYRHCDDPKDDYLRLFVQFKHEGKEESLTRYYNVSGGFCMLRAAAAVLEINETMNDPKDEPGEFDRVSAAHIWEEAQRETSYLNKKEE